MPSEREERIRQRAYEIWEREGKPDGREAEHWDKAAAEIDAERESTEAMTSAADTTEAGAPPAPPETPPARRSRSTPKRAPAAKAKGC
jgi:hypothetical protein